MLKMADTKIEKFLPLFSETGIPVAFLVPTPTGYGKAIMDATETVRSLLKETGTHNYEIQGQGPAYKHLVESYFVHYNGLEETSTSLYRPVTKKGDPRIWFSNLKKYCEPCNLLALIVIEQKIYVFNLSNPLIVQSLLAHEFAYDVLLEAKHKQNVIAEELLAKLRGIHRQGCLPSITPGDPGVGDTLENALGISRNNSKQPDYKGIELKTSRLTMHGSKSAKTRSTLFTKVPDVGMTYREIVENYGKIQTPKGATEARLQLYETFRMSRPNAYDLILDINRSRDDLEILHQKEARRRYVSGWHMDSLRNALLIKHNETFWISAISEDRGGREYFRYEKVLHTKKPNASLIEPLLEIDKITVDLAAHITNGHWRDHGVLFKMKPEDLPLLLGSPVEYDLSK